MPLPLQVKGRPPPAAKIRGFIVVSPAAGKANSKPGGDGQIVAR